MFASRGAAASPLSPRSRPQQRPLRRHRADAAVNGAEPVAASDAAHPGAVTAPMVGTIYVAPEPGAAPFVAQGAKVQEGDTLFIIEAMKTMNPVRAPRAGTVNKVLVENETPVEYGEVLAVIE